MNSGRAMAPNASSTPRSKKRDFNVVASSVPDARNSTPSDALSRKKRSASVTSCAPAIVAVATPSRRGSPAPTAAAKSGPSIAAVR